MDSRQATLPANSVLSTNPLKDVPYPKGATVDATILTAVCACGNTVKQVANSTNTVY